MVNSIESVGIYGSIKQLEYNSQVSYLRNLTTTDFGMTILKPTDP